MLKSWSSSREANWARLWSKVSWSRQLLLSKLFNCTWTTATSTKRRTWLSERVRLSCHPKNSNKRNLISLSCPRRAILSNWLIVLCVTLPRAYLLPLDATKSETACNLLQASLKPLVLLVSVEAQQMLARSRKNACSWPRQMTSCADARLPYSGTKKKWLVNRTTPQATRRCSLKRSLPHSMLALSATSYALKVILFSKPNLLRASLKSSRMRRPRNSN